MHDRIINQQGDAHERRQYGLGVLAGFPPRVVDPSACAAHGRVVPSVNHRDTAISLGIRYSDEVEDTSAVGLRGCLSSVSQLRATGFKVTKHSVRGPVSQVLGNHPVILTR
jgi:hypothetical protein